MPLKWPIRGGLKMQAPEHVTKGDYLASRLQKFINELNLNPEVCF